MPEQPTLIVAYPNKTFKSGETLDRSTVTLEPAKVSECDHCSAKIRNYYCTYNFLKKCNRGFENLQLQYKLRKKIRKRGSEIRRICNFSQGVARDDTELPKTG